MKRALLVLPLGGCYIGGHGSIDRPVHGNARASTTPQGHLDLGLGAADEKQAVVLLMSIGSTPLVAEGDDPDAPATVVFAMGGRYERAFSARRPWLRGFSRLTLGGSFCPDEDAPMSEEPDPACDTPEEARSVSVTSLALGVAFTATAEQKSDEISPTYGTIGVAVVYTLATDEALGAADFLGLELSCGFGGDALAGFLRKDR